MVLEFKNFFSTLQTIGLSFAVVATHALTKLWHCSPVIISTGSPLSSSFEVDIRTLKILFLSSGFSANLDLCFICKKKLRWLLALAIFIIPSTSKCPR